MASPIANNSVGQASQDVAPSAVTISQAPAQTDPTSAATMNVMAASGEPVSASVMGNVTLGGTVGATTATASNSDVTHYATVGGMIRGEIILASVAASTVHDAVDPSAASTNADDLVQYTPPATFALGTPNLGTFAVVQSTAIRATAGTVKMESSSQLVHLTSPSGIAATDRVELLTAVMYEMEDLLGYRHASGLNDNGNDDGSWL